MLSLGSGRSPTLAFFGCIRAARGFTPWCAGEEMLLSVLGTVGVCMGLCPSHAAINERLR